MAVTDDIVYSVVAMRTSAPSSAGESADKHSHAIYAVLYEHLQHYSRQSPRKRDEMGIRDRAE